MTVRTLLLMRHAKSDYPEGVTDRDRPLAPRGERDAVAAATWLGATYPRVDDVVVSPACRAQQTWALVSSQVHAGTVRQDARVYDDWGERLQDVVMSLPAQATTALIVGHNPGIEDLAIDLGRSGDAAARERMASKYPTCAIATIGFLGPWTDLARTTLLAFTVPRG
jgi:phosphohistidine phosphatase